MSNSQKIGLAIVGTVFAISAVGLAAWGALRWLGTSYRQAVLLHRNMMFYYWAPYHWGWSALAMVVLMALFLGLVVWGAVAAGRAIASHDASHSALEILRVRYARGEITRDEYKAKKKELG